MTVATVLLLLALAPVEAAQPQPPVVAVPWPPPRALQSPPPPPVIVVPPQPQPPIVMRAPQPRRIAQDYISADDYPASALAAREEGRVAFLLAVGPSGRVHGCIVTQSSGSPALDSATCAIMRRRARFTPAIDSNGQPGSAMVAQEVEWKLPAGAERG